MNRSTKTRFAIFQILIEIYKKNFNFETIFNKKITEFQFNQKEISFINNVCLNTMRKHIHCRIILNKFVKKSLKTREYILLSSAVVQIFYLKMKPYAVVNETVNVSKKIGVYPSLINAILKNIINNINDLNKLIIRLEDFPQWFVDQVNRGQTDYLDCFLKTFDSQPSLHLVFKSKEAFCNFREPFTKSSNKSAFVCVQKKISNLHNYDKGNWWVQDFSSMIPLAINNNINNLEILDICAAPGGKSFQILSDNKVTLNDINSKRILRLKENLKRLKFSPEINNFDGLSLKEYKKYDIVILDSPCSSVGTIRKNPEIFFKSKKPDFSKLNKLQRDLLNKSSKLVKNKGKIIYMVCSFLQSETLDIVKEFLKVNTNFSVEKYKANKDTLNVKSLISQEGHLLTPPKKFKNYYIDGFFSAQLVRHD